MHIYTESSLAIYYNANKQTNETNEIGIKQQKQNIYRERKEREKTKPHKYMVYLPMHEAVVKKRSSRMS